MKFIATADWQLGMTAHYLDDEARPRYQQARFDVLYRIAELADEREVDFVVVGGDIFESNQLHRSVVARAVEALKEFSVPVYLLPGNHDPLDAMSILGSEDFATRCPDNIHVITDAMPLEVAPDIRIVGAPWFSKDPHADLVGKTCAALEPSPGLRILVGHGATTSTNPDQTSAATIDEAQLQAALADGRLHFVVLGDKHLTHQVAERIWYPGTPEVTHRRESDPGNVLVVDLEADRCEVEKVHVGTWQFRTVEEELNSLDDVEAFRQRLDAWPDKSRSALWLVLRGTLSTAAHARLEQVLEHAGEVFARVGQWERHMDLAVLPDHQDFDDLALAKFAQDAVAELKGQARGDDEATAATAQDSLALLYRLAGGGR